MFPAGLKRALPSRAQVSRWTVYALFAGLFITFPTAVVTAPAANAAACSADENRFVAMNLALFQNQPSGENTGKWQNPFFIELGKSIGINSTTFESCVNDGKYVDWTTNVASASAKADVNSTPTVLINGKPLDRNTQYGDPANFKAALEAAGVK